MGAAAAAAAAVAAMGAAAAAMAAEAAAEQADLLQCKLHVRPISWRVTPEQMIAAFGGAGKVLSAQNLAKQKREAPQGFGFVTFRSADVARKMAAHATRSEMFNEGVTIVVQPALPPLPPCAPAQKRRPTAAVLSAQLKRMRSHATQESESEERHAALEAASHAAELEKCTRELVTALRDLESARKQTALRDLESARKQQPSALPEGSVSSPSVEPLSSSDEEDGEEEGGGAAKHGGAGAKRKAGGGEGTRDKKAKFEEEQRLWIVLKTETPVGEYAQAFEVGNPSSIVIGTYATKEQAAIAKASCISKMRPFVETFEDMYDVWGGGAIGDDLYACGDCETAYVVEIREIVVPAPPLRPDLVTENAKLREQLASLQPELVDLTADAGGAHSHSRPPPTPPSAPAVAAPSALAQLHEAQQVKMEAVEDMQDEGQTYAQFIDKLQSKIDKLKQLAASTGVDGAAIEEAMR
jgi:hypothetical protein